MNTFSLLVFTKLNGINDTLSQTTKLSGLMAINTHPQTSMNKLHEVHDVKIQIGNIKHDMEKPIVENNYTMSTKR